MDRNAREIAAEDLTIDLTIEELDEVAAADCAGTASTASTPVSTAACIGCASF
jgi:hypothetical protein